jgi:hypothetical protein
VAPDHEGSIGRGPGGLKVVPRKGSEGLLPSRGCPTTKK